MELEEVIRIKSNIKAIGWTYISVFSGLGLYLLYNIIMGMQMHFAPFVQASIDNTEYYDFKNLLYNFIFVYVLALGFSIITIVIAYELKKFRRWAATALHLVSVIIVLLGGHEKP